jgi:ubiquinone/menaquinone biosynthesis C-methylase UbiE
MLKGNYWQVEGVTGIGEEYQTNFLTDEIYGLEGCHKWLLDVISDNESILDIGCGPGIVYEIFRRAGRNNDYLGIDINPKNLVFAQTLFPGIQTRQTDCYFLPWADNDVDNSILFDVLDSLPDFRKALDEATRVTRKQVIITFDRNYTLIDGFDANCIGVDFPTDYIVRINRTKFIDYINKFGYLIKEGTIKAEGIDRYDYWIIDKTKKL